MTQNKKYLRAFTEEFKNNPQVHALTLPEAQGVEFEIVCLVGVNENWLDIADLPNELKKENQKIQRDLLYVALTRAINEMHVMGTVKLGDINS